MLDATVTKRLRRHLLRRLRHEQSARFFRRIVIAQTRRALPQVGGDVFSELLDAGLVGVAAALARVHDELDAASAAMSREES